MYEMPLINVFGFWGLGEHFLFWGFGQWHFVIGVLSRDREENNGQEDLFTADIPNK